MFEVPAGGPSAPRCWCSRSAWQGKPVPCIVREGGLAEEDSLAENVHREALHPLDQFRAFQDLREKGFGEDEIAARFFVAPSVVRQRLRLASVSPRLLDLYAEDALTLEQLMAFSVTDDHARQEQVWESLQHMPDWNQRPHQIRRQLTEEAVRGDDARAVFVGSTRMLPLQDRHARLFGGWGRLAAGCRLPTGWLRKGCGRKRETIGAEG